MGRTPASGLPDKPRRGISMRFYFCLMTSLLASLAPLSLKFQPVIDVPATTVPVADDAGALVTPATQPMADLGAKAAVPRMTPGINIGNTLENTTRWETGWGAPPITQQYVQSLAQLGFKSVRLPIAWDTYAKDGRIQPEQFHRVAEVIRWITDAGLFCVINIHWDGGWIDSDVKPRYPRTYHTFSLQAEAKFRSYWNQIARFFAGTNERVLFEALNEESNFDNAGSPRQALAALGRVNQIFVDTVRQAGGNNARRLLIITGYTADIARTCNDDFRLPLDPTPGKLLISVHYYTPWPFVGMNGDTSWEKMQTTWGSPADVWQLNGLFEQLNALCIRTDTPAYVGEFAVVSHKEEASRRRWTSAVAAAAITRHMVPVLWDTGTAVSRQPPYAASDDLLQLLRRLPRPPPTSQPTS